jgi:hypothetical protein
MPIRGAIRLEGRGTKPNYAQLARISAAAASSRLCARSVRKGDSPTTCVHVCGRLQFNESLEELDNHSPCHGVIGEDFLDPQREIIEGAEGCRDGAELLFLEYVRRFDVILSIERRVNLGLASRSRHEEVSNRQPSGLTRPRRPMDLRRS